MDDSKTIQNITSDKLDDQGANNMSDAIIRNVPGTSINTNRFGQRTDYMIRGFNIDDNNGTKINGQYHLGWADPDLFSIDKIDVMKGPGGALYGKADPGGIVNITTKQPSLYETSYETEQKIGNYGFHSHSFSASGPVYTDNGTGVAYYLGGTVSDSDTFHENAGKSRESLIGDILFQGRDSKLTLEGRYLRDENSWAGAGLLPAVGKGPAGLPLNTNFSSSSDHWNVNDKSFGYRFSSDINDNWTFENNSKYQSVTRTMKYLNPSSINQQTGAYTMKYYWTDAGKDLYSTNTDVVYHGSVFGYHNDFTVGTDYLYAYGYQTARTSNSSTTFNIYNQASYPTNLVWPTNFTSTISRSPVSSVGTYAQDKFYFNDKWILDFGVRFDDVNQHSDTLTKSQWVPQYDRSDNAISKNVGLTYKPTNSVSLYGDYSEGFNVQSPSTTQSYDPQYTKSVEAGVKTESYDKSIITNTDVFQWTMSNIQTTDVLNPNLVDLTGEERVRGIEHSDSIGLSKEVTWINNAAFMEAIITKDNNYKGNTFASVPKWSGSSWLMYTPHDEQFEGFGIGGGPRFMSKRQGDNANDFTLPSYVVFDSSVYYKFNKNVKTQLDVKNILNSNYYAGSNSRYNIMPGEPLTIIGSISVKF